MTHVLGLTDDPALIAALRRVAAAADRELHEAVAPPSRRSWTDAAVVVVDHASALACAADLPRRPGVVLVCPGAADLREWQAAAVVGAEHVLGLPDSEVELLAVIGATAEPDAAGGTVIAVVGGCGGAGASTFAAALAWSSARRDSGRDVLLVDADPYGCGIDVLTGLEERPGVRWSGLTVESGRISARALRDAVPSWTQGLGVLSTDRDSGAQLTAGAATAVVDAVHRSGTTVIADIGRAFGPVADALLSLADLTAVVVPARVGAALSSARIADRLLDRAVPAGLVVRGPAPGGLTPDDVAEVTGLPLLASMRPEPGLAETLERGGIRLRSRSPLVGAAEALLDGLDPARPRTRWIA